MTLGGQFAVRFASPVSPEFKRTVSAFEQLKPKLEMKANNFNLKGRQARVDRSFFVPQAAAGGGYEGASGYALIDFDTGEVLLSKNLSEKLPIASLTKIMTAVVALDLANPDEQFRVSENAAAQVPTKVMLKSGEKYSLKDLIASLLISSANDSAQVLREGIDAKYGEDVFVKAMNHKAKVLGLENTRFTNPQGFDNRNHRSTAADLGILSVYAIKNYPLIGQTVSLQTLDLTDGGRDMRFYLQNWNGLLGVYPGAAGIKIGNTGKAGYTTIVLSEREGKTLLAVLLGAPGVLERDLWTAELLDEGFGKLGISPAGITEEILRQKYSSWRYL